MVAPMAKTAAQVRLDKQRAARIRWSQTADRTAATAPGRAAFLSRFADAPQTRRAYFQALGRRGGKARHGRPHDQ
jgi:hypothetical protein